MSHNKPRPVEYKVFSCYLLLDPSPGVYANLPNPPPLLPQGMPNHSSATKNSRETLLESLRTHKVDLKKVAPSLMQDANSSTTKQTIKTANTLSDILGGALAKIKEVNINYGNELYGPLYDDDDYTLYDDWQDYTL